MNSIKAIQLLCLASIFMLFTNCDSSTTQPVFQNIETGNDTGGPACKAMVSGSLMSEISADLENVRRDSESHMHELNDLFPDFGGVFIDEDGRYNVFLTNMSDEARV